MASYGTERDYDGRVEHLGSLSIDDIESIFVESLNRRLIGAEARQFWSSNGDLVVQFASPVWRGFKDGRVVVFVHPVVRMGDLDPDSINHVWSVSKHNVELESTRNHGDTKWFRVMNHDVRLRRLATGDFEGADDRYKFLHVRMRVF